MFGLFGNSYSDDEEQKSESENEEAENDSQHSSEVKQKSMADYYDDLESVITSIRDQIENADDDPAFQHAAKVLTKVIDLCHDIESSINPVTVLQTNNERSRLLKTLGPDGMIEIKGEASRLLVIEYRKLMIALANKEYWPAPALFTSLVNARYESELEKHAEETQRRIKKYQERVDAYDQAKAQQANAPARQLR